MGELSLNRNRERIKMKEYTNKSIHDNFMQIYLGQIFYGADVLILATLFIFFACFFLIIIVFVIIINFTV